MDLENGVTDLGDGVKAVDTLNIVKGTKPAEPVKAAEPTPPPEPKRKRKPEPPPQKYVYQALIPNTDLGRYVYKEEVVKLDSPLPENLCRVETAAEMAARGARGTPKPAHWRFSGKHDA